jgi:serine/threonine protein kinase
VAHGDIKPDNLLLTPSGEVVLLDFGAARGMGPGGPAAAFAGFTPRWATAERAQGAPPEPADDIHAMAAILYRLAQGGIEGPPQRLSGMGRGSWEMLRLALEPRRASQPGSGMADSKSAGNNHKATTQRGATASRLMAAPALAWSACLGSAG